jgi:hypothetical protein
MATKTFRRVSLIVSMALIALLIALILYVRYYTGSEVTGDWKGTFTYVSANIKRTADVSLKIAEKNKGLTGFLTLVETPKEIEVLQEFDVAAVMREKRISMEGQTEDLKTRIEFMGTATTHRMKGTLKRFHQTFFFDTIVNEGTLTLSK